MPAAVRDRAGERLRQRNRRDPASRAGSSGNAKEGYSAPQVAGAIVPIRLCIFGGAVMATLLLGAAGAALGSSIGGSILGVSAATIGGMVGSSVGAVVDSWIVSSLAPGQRFEGPRLDSLRITHSTEDAVIPRLYGRMRIGGNIIWATDFREETRTTRQGGGKGGGPSVRTTEYLYYASFAVALRSPASVASGLTANRWTSFIAAKMGADATPAYRSTADVVFEELPLDRFGNRLPQVSFEVFRPLADPDTAEGLTRAVTMIPASVEFTYATQPIRKSHGGGATMAENLNAPSLTPDIVVALDRLQAMGPKVESVSLVVAWFGDDQRAGHCRVRPGGPALAIGTAPWPRLQAASASCGGCLAPVMKATASDMECSFGSITQRRRPRRWTWTRSATSKTCGMLWLMSTMGVPRARTSRMSSSTLRLSLTPRAAVGSSRMMTFEPKAAARATATPWRCPPERVSTAWLMFWIVKRPSSESLALAKLSMAGRSSIRSHLPIGPARRISRPMNMLSAIDSAGDRARFW
jgi:hypothetical protein